MKRSVFLIFEVALVLNLLDSYTVFAAECFKSTTKLNNNVQTIRLKALDRGWKVGKPASLTATSIVKGKGELYPQGNVDFCLKEDDGLLWIRVQSQSKAAGKGDWRKIPAKKVN